LDKVASLLASIDETQQTLTEATTTKAITPNKSLNLDTMSKADALQLFKEMLEQNGVGSNWKWEDANRVVQADPMQRFNVFRSMSDRRWAFTEY
jgi:hypothetical protein